MSILVTGGAGYIGSHTCVELINAGNDIVIVDNLINSSKETIRRIQLITGKNVKFYEFDIRDEAKLKTLFQTESIEAVMHFAGYKAVGESVQKPLEYYNNNVTGSLVLFEVMQSFHVKNLVFSSSATVYGNSARVPIREDFPLYATNPYGRTKLMLEEILGDLHQSDEEWNMVILRYFNPIGAHKSALIGEDPRGIPNNLLPYISQVACGKRKELKVFGNDYETADGSGVRDYIHVVDLAQGHVKALERLRSYRGISIYNLGTGIGYSVFDIIKAYRNSCGKEIPYIITSRRPGDIAISYADPALAQKELGWSALYGIEEMCKDAWRWQFNNPDGYQTSR